MTSPSVCHFRDLAPNRFALAGGKGGTLARLYRARYPVPPGFLILPSAFQGNQADPASKQAIARLLRQIRSEARRRGNGDVSFAVRSSALAEDSKEHSFAGQMETVLDCVSDDAVLDAVIKVRASGRGERALAYAASRGLEREQDEASVAVVVQQMVHPVIAGVLFTADPISGSRMTMVGNFVEGTGETLVSGEANAKSFSIARPGGCYDGPPEARRYARALFRLGNRLERELGGPQDIEWAVSSGRVFILQSRPVTTLRGHNLASGEWNDSLTGDLLWTNSNFSEAVPDVMTPCTWSWWGWLHAATLPVRASGYSVAGNIGGRAYANLTFMASLYRSAGMDVAAALRRESETFGRIPAGVDVPLLPISGMESMGCRFGLVRIAIHIFLAGLRAPRAVEANNGWCRATRERLASANAGPELCRLWDTVIAPYAVNLFWVLKSVTQSYESRSAFRRTLSKVIGEADANALLSNLRGAGETLASLGPVVGLASVVSGDMTEAEYFEAHGHRGPHEAELSTPRPAEDPTWLMREMDAARRNPIDVESLLERQLARHRAAVERLKSENPSLARAVLRKVDVAAQAARMREAVRSEVVRASWVARDWALKAGQLTGLGEGIFFLAFPEMKQVLMGDDRARRYIEPREATYRTYCSLPPYPAVIRGRFDPGQWAKSPDRRPDLFDSHVPARPAGRNEATIRGFPGAGGRVQARVRRLASPEESYLLQPGEVLVTATTNVGWTLLFPRCAAVVTDVGAPLSHAAIVARELGIPAVVGCGDATMWLHTGDLVSVDGGLGIVELVDQVSEHTDADADPTTSTPAPRIS